MRSWIIFIAVLIILTTVPLSFGDEPIADPSEGVNSRWIGVYNSMKDALPQMAFLAVLLINLATALIDADRNMKASLIATMILAGLTYWGGFYKPLFEFLTAKL